MGSDVMIKAVDNAGNISIHAPRMGSDLRRFIKPECHVAISIHAPRMGSDVQSGKFDTVHFNFNPRSPHGERRRV